MTVGRGRHCGSGQLGLIGALVCANEAACVCYQIGEDLGDLCGAFAHRVTGCVCVSRNQGRGWGEIAT